MPRVPVRVIAPAPDVRAGLARLREELRVPTAFPDAVVTAATEAARRHASRDDGRVDARDLPLVTIDPPRSRDLDQAFTAGRDGDGYRVQYAIADVSAFVAADDTIDREAHVRGVTLYLPDRRAPLYPNVLGEGAASLLPGRDRPALLWTFRLDGRGEPVETRLERAIVRSRHALAYVDVQHALERGRAPEAFALLRKIGQLREARERDRGGVSLRVPTQEVLPAPGGYRLVYEAPLAVEDWNAQISLLTGMTAAHLMVEAGVGILRVLPPPDERGVARLRRSARALGIEWPESSSYADVVRTLDPSIPHHAALLTQAVRVLRGAGYSLVGAEAGPPPVHSALASVYAHVTAPLRRLADRFANEIVLAASGGRVAPSWAVEALAALPDLMQDANRHAAAVERAVIDLMEAVVLRGLVGERLRGTIVDSDDDRATVQLQDPPVVASVAARGHTLGDEVVVEVRAAEPVSRKVVLEPV